MKMYQGFTSFRNRVTIKTPKNYYYNLGLYQSLQKANLESADWKICRSGTTLQRKC